MKVKLSIPELQVLNDLLKCTTVPYQFLEPCREKIGKALKKAHRKVNERRKRSKRKG